ncbi:hypothetical protein PV661_32745 [Streptomyces sp. MD20-1-1]|jgi:hypothetical protein|uniref:hypothetical protein n=1 Tax=Streptomyces sp. MD20-1-1 TaxID=3028668 RepID=UPI0029A82BD4|nr:hypothetical protein [Streptomyces sp. MD20-1-1]WTC16816.1 hypothetical protein OH709_13425 [Streptomyces cellulosae]
MDENLSDFGWFFRLEEDGIYPTISVIEGADRERVMQILAGEDAEWEGMSVKEAVDKVARDVDVIGLGEDSGLVFTIEAISSTLAVPGVLREISQNGRCVSAAFSSEGVCSFHYAVRGELIAYEFDAGYPVWPLTAGDDRWDATWSESTTDFDESEIVQGVHLLSLIGQVMGIAPQASWFKRQLWTIKIPSSVRFEGSPAWNIP